MLDWDNKGAGEKTLLRAVTAAEKIADALHTMAGAMDRGANALANIATAFQVQVPPPKPVPEGVTMEDEGDGEIWDEDS